ncbi:CoA ester lyase [Caulobacter sp. CCH5-E12]|uniref:HpcH/HpaI aldolase/citrate lyase family protein n=1 Tax=Caulobacter sp. CCH5-E12 TaxID=1768770 RepID=UPI0007809809|nr:CoA ester lyase [Caulobacter sp. CCH5-E12]
MKLRSLLFVPGDRPERFDKAAASGADAIILDLEDAVAPARKAFARQAVADYLAAAVGGVVRLVRINPVDSPWLRADLQTAAASQGLVLPKAEGVETFDRLDAAAKDLSLPPILPIATETPLAVFRMAEYVRFADRLLGLTWGAEDLPAAIGAAGSRDAAGLLTAPYQLVRTLSLFAAHAAKTLAIETVYPNIRDLDGLAAYAARGAFDGFSGMMAIHPSQVEAINLAFTPTAEALDQARSVVAAFAETPGAGAVQWNGRMLDAPHLKQALRLLGEA